MNPNLDISQNNNKNISVIYKNISKSVVTMLIKSIQEIKLGQTACKELLVVQRLVQCMHIHS